MKPKLPGWWLALLLAAALTACFNPDAYVAPSGAGRIAFGASARTALADGVSVAELQAQLTADAAPGRRAVVFKTTLGSFKKGQGDSLVVQADSSGLARAELVSGRAGTATVSVRAGSLRAVKTQQIEFQPAFPDALTASVDSFSISNALNSELLLAATLRTANGGKPSVGHPVSFVVFTAAGDSVGAFLNGQNVGSTDANGVARVRYSPGRVNYQGFLTVRARTRKADNTLLAATTPVYLYRK